MLFEEDISDEAVLAAAKAFDPEAFWPDDVPQAYGPGAKEASAADSLEKAREVLVAALPYLRFGAMGDNHHSAVACPYCVPHEGLRLAMVDAMAWATEVRMTEMRERLDEIVEALKLHTGR
jgi:hypothetical protein